MLAPLTKLLERESRTHHAAVYKRAAILLTIPGYVLGLVRYPAGRYALALGLAELPYAVGTVYLGASFVEGRSGTILITGALIALFSLVTFYALRRALRESGRAQLSSASKHVAQSIAPGVGHERAND